MISIKPSELETKQVYKLMTGSVIPRPIAWVSTKAADGTLNLAPFSYFSAVGANPPTVLFCIGKRDTEKDTYTNVVENGEFVVNFVNVATAEAMNITAAVVPPEIDEFDRANLTPIDSSIISVPRVKESPIHFECKMTQIVEAGGSYIVIGEVVCMHFAEEVYQEGNYIDVEAYQAIARLSGKDYAHLGELFQLVRPPAEIK